MAARSGCLSEYTLLDMEVVTQSRRTSDRASVPRPGKALAGTTFALYCIYTIDYYVRVSARFPSVAALRPTLIMFAIIVALLFVQWPQLKGRLTNRPSRALLALLAYLAASLPFVTWPGSVLHNLDPFVQAVAFFLFSALILDTEFRLFAFLTVFVGCQVFRVLDPLYLHITTGYLGTAYLVGHTYIGNGNFAGRLSGGPFDVVNPNGLGFVTVTCIPFLYYCLFGAKQLYRKLLAIALIGASLYVIYLTLSRGAMIALFVVIWMIFRKTKRKILFAACVAAIISVAWVHSGGIHRDRYLSLLGGHGSSQSSMQTAEDQSAEGRIQVTEEEFWIGMERPIFGHGLGTTAEAKEHNGHGPQASHNLYTELLVEIGAVGGFFFLRFMYSIYVELKDIERVVAARESSSARHIDGRLVQAFVAVFWMYVVFSANYFGLSQDYWYALGGLVTAFALQSRPMLAEQAATGKTQSASGRGEQPLRSPGCRSDSDLPRDPRSLSHKPNTTIR